MKKATWRARLRYQFDKSMAAGSVALIAWLALISLMIIIAAAVLLAFTGIAPEGGERLTMIDGLWAALMRTVDAGALGGDNGWSFRIVMLIVTVGGIFIFSALIGVLNSGWKASSTSSARGGPRFWSRSTRSSSTGRRRSST